MADRRGPLLRPGNGGGMTDPEELIEKAARVIANCDGVDRWSGCLENTREDIRDEARALAAAGLLADPEQGSELERLKAELEEAETDTDVLQGEINDAVTWLSAKGFAVNARECTMRQNVSRVVKQITAEIEQLQARIDKALALHTESKLYTECGHDHTDDDSDDLLYVDEVGTVCEDGYLVTICRVCCCTASGDQSEECASHHDGPCWPCPTRAALLPGDETPQPEEDQ